MAFGSVVSSSLFLIYVAYRLFVGKVQVFNRSSMRRQWGAQAPVVFVFSQQQQRMYKVRWRTAGVPPSRIWAARSTAVCGCSQAQDVLHKRGAPHPSQMGGSEAIRADPDATPEASPADPPVYRALSTWPACAGIGARANTGCVCPQAGG